jgi:hypothetical protein
MKILSYLVLALGLIFASCGDSGSQSATEQAPSQLDQSSDNTPQINITNPEATGGNERPVAASVEGGQHYICPNNCEGSGGPSAGTCPVCGTDYVHNAGFHQKNSPAADGTGNPVISTNPTSAEPAQNANGVWHYTCPNGCAGGGGSAGPCSSCGTTLAHNPAYHQ